MKIYLTIQAEMLTVEEVLFMLALVAFMDFFLTF